jgi:hypothetical protein
MLTTAGGENRHTPDALKWGAQVLFTRELGRGSGGAKLNAKTNMCQSTQPSHDAPHHHARLTCRSASDARVCSAASASCGLLLLDRPSAAVSVVRKPEDSACLHDGSSVHNACMRAMPLDGLQAIDIDASSLDFGALPSTVGDWNRSADTIVCSLFQRGDITNSQQRWEERQSTSQPGGG